ncbi:indole-3-glycerol phosphate synthase TrpC [Bacillus altitudinis]|uniref:indole-3-glycerol phosphate synthase TrpC n=1 Tax=Bacillus altitudinis TaxID=293387 RepID=UPI0020A76296|nr:indole-3-glycerol phosphate synthase TrpC [Bacillus altitudinis]USY49687.1 indole-3-glycerol phosphate synthase TrpC [Bacillus altitudinis]
MLNQIIARKKEHVKTLQLPEDGHYERRSFKESLMNPHRSIGLIAEVKKASPSKGIIQPHFDPLQTAKAYEASNADCLSVLTDEPFFQGKNEYLSLIKEHITRPILRKDFIIDSIQVEESKRIGADAILLIGEVLEPQKLYELCTEAKEKGLDVLVEVHAAHTLEKILHLFTPEIIGVNNRNLNTFTTTVEQTKEIAPLVPKDVLLVSESGIKTFDDLTFVKQHGANAVLVGESLMREQSQEKAVQALFGE